MYICANTYFKNFLYFSLQRLKYLNVAIVSYNCFLFVLFLLIPINLDIHNTGVPKRKEEQQIQQHDHMPNQKKPRLVFTDLQRRTLQAIFKVSQFISWDNYILANSFHSQETKRPSKEMQVTIARQLGLEPTTVGNFFMNARRRSMDKWKESG